VVGPEDAARRRGSSTISQTAGPSRPFPGPGKLAAQLEGLQGGSQKRRCATEFNISEPAPLAAFTNAADGRPRPMARRRQGAPIVVKGRRGFGPPGKGRSFVCDDDGRSRKPAIRHDVFDGAFGRRPGTEVVIEGVSRRPRDQLLCRLCDGETAIPAGLPPRDHKRVFDHDRGDRTPAGMGRLFARRDAFVTAGRISPTRSWRRIIFWPDRWPG